MKKKLKSLVAATFACLTVFSSAAQWTQNADGSISTGHDVKISGAFTYSDNAPMKLVNASLEVPNGNIFTNKFMGVGTQWPATRLTVENGSFLLHMKQNSGYSLNADFELGEIGTRFFYNAARSLFRGGEINFIETNNDRGFYSFAFGKDPKALGYYAVSLGYSTNASGYCALAIGDASSATNTGSIAIGNSTSHGQYAIALGKSSAKPNYSFAAGKSTVNTGLYASALGASVADGDYSLAAGQSYTNGSNSVALGQASTAGSYSIAAGQNAAAVDNNAIALGNNVKASAYNAVTIGSGNFTNGQQLDNKIKNSLMIGFNCDQLPSVFVGPADQRINEKSTFGFVGIGTTTPKYELSVNGTVVAKTAVLVENLPGQWPDYVFDDNYVLTPLHEVEKFVQAHHHLPGVPSQKQVEKEGLNLGEMEMVMLRKIEELTLHMIKLEKENEKLKSQMEKLQHGR